MGTLISLLTGPLLGGLGGAALAAFQKWFDFKDAKDKRAHELAMRDKDLELARLESASKAELAKVDADTQIAVKEGDMQIAALAADKATYGDSIPGRIVDFMRGIVRPLITYAAAAWFGILTYYALKHGPPLSQEMQAAILMTGTTLTSGVISFWFGIRGKGGLARQRA